MICEMVDCELLIHREMTLKFVVDSQEANIKVS